VDAPVETTRGWKPCVSLSVPIRADLSWRTGDQPGHLELMITGELCVWTMSCIEPAVWGLVSDLRPVTVTLDLSGVTFIDARGVSLLSRLARHVAASDGGLIVTRPSHLVTRLLAMVGIDRELHLAARLGSLDGAGEDPRVALANLGGEAGTPASCT
jgi:anti-anti-sigma factor